MHRKHYIGDIGNLRSLTVLCNRMSQHLKIDTIAKGGTSKKNAICQGTLIFTNAVFLHYSEL